MIRFIIKSFFRDRNRCLIPVMIVTIGVALTITMTGYNNGMMDDRIELTANIKAGHLKVMTRAYAANSSQIPNDLAIIGTGELISKLDRDYPNYSWKERILTPGIIDYYDNDGTHISQGNVGVLGFDMLGPDHSETERLNIPSSLVRGYLPSKPDEVILSELLSSKMGLEIGDTISYMGTTMNGSLTFALYKLAGICRFGVPKFDKGMMLMDISAVKLLMDMEDASGEILGFRKKGGYIDKEAIKIADDFNNGYASSDDVFFPVMIPLRRQNLYGEYIDYVNSVAAFFVFLFLLVMSIVLWNTGLIAGLRRYHEFGIRLALGETKGHIYISQLIEAVIVGVAGSFFGTIIGIASVYLLSVKGIDISMIVKETSINVPTVLRAKFSTNLLYIGYLPGVLAMCIGTMLSGLGIYKRQTSRLMKEMEL